jgi:prepilin-type N-terminal cleavage/methylation domain-containing protein
MARQDGYTLVELMMVVAIIGILGGMATSVTTHYLGRAKADGSVLSLVSVLELARNRAIAERRNFEITFQPPNRVIVQRVNITNGVPSGRTTIADVLLENGFIYKQFTGLPDTPDLFGAASSVDFDGTGPIAFTSDGSLIDQFSEPSNATIFIGQNSTDSNTARAITIMGATGLMKTFAWGRTQWIG